MGKSTKSTQTVSYPGYVEDAQKGLLTAATGMAAPFLRGSNYGVAGQNADQQKAAELARQSAMGAFNTDYSSRIADAGKGYDAAKLTGADITAMMNPYTDNVINPTLARMGQQRDITDAQIGAKNASSVAFNGSGSALERGQLNRSFGENVASTVGGLLSSGYDQAAQLAAMNVQAENAARSNNAGMRLQALGAADSAANNSYNRQQGALQTLLGIGNQNQQFAQSAIDLPWTQISRLGGLLPTVGGTTTQTTPTNPLSTILGIASLPLKGTVGGSLFGS